MLHQQNGIDNNVYNKHGVCLCGQCLENSLPVPCGASPDVIDSREKRNQSLPVPCGASPYVTSPNVTDSREKRNQGQFDFLRQKIW